MNGPAELQEGLGRVQAAFPAWSCPPVRWQSDTQTAVELTDQGVLIRYATRIGAFRALGQLMSDGLHAFTVQPRFDLFGVMLDVSRNGVLRPDYLEPLMVRLALLGVHAFMLYTEDTYEVPGAPFFGYLRGRYSSAELTHLDAVADSLGMEMIPCIETLGHLEQVLQWPPYQDLTDVPGTLLVGDDRSLKLLQDMIHAASSCFRSRRIHVGLDETFRLGEGRYRELHGSRPSVDVFMDHLTTVRGICQQLALRPMMWSDMFFHGDDAYDPKAVLPPEVHVPPDVDMVFWDYYHTDSASYEMWLQKHRALGTEPIMATGIWTWNRLWTALPFSRTVLDASLSACKRLGVRQAMVTLWGDDGQECPLSSALPALVWFAEHGYADRVDPAAVERRFRALWGGSTADVEAGCRLDTIPFDFDASVKTRNISKALLWEDPLLPLLDGQFQADVLAARYGDLAGHLREPFPAQVARVLSLKVDLRTRLAAAYARQDRGALRHLRDTHLAALRGEMRTLWKLHRDTWMAARKPFGWEVLEDRYGGLMARLETVSDRLTAYLNDPTQRLPELEVAIEKVFEDDVPDIEYAQAKTPSCIK